jgi:hypothetical protein
MGEFRKAQGLMLSLVGVFTNKFTLDIKNEQVISNNYTR